MPRPKASTTARGYGADHKALRAKWAARIQQGGVTCWRCGRPILPGTAWDLGHDDHDRSQYRGPECRSGNRAAGARKANTRRRARRAALTRQRTTRLTW